MAVPNHLAIVQQVYAAGHYDLTTKIGCGRFLEDVVPALRAVDPRWGHLRKRPGQNRWNDHAVDNPLYLSDTPGQSTAVDIVSGAESTSAGLWWNPDQPRYSASDWYEGPPGDSFVLPPHTCRLGCSLFWLLGGYKFHRDQLTKNLAWARHDLGADYIRAFFCCTGIPAWDLIGSDPTWPDFDAVVAGAQDLVRSFGLKIAWCVVGEAGGAPDPLGLCDRFVSLTDPALYELVECWNELELTGGDRPTIRAMAERLWSHLGSAALIALDTPHHAMAAPTSEHQEDLLIPEVNSFYGGSVATCITPQWDRSQPNPRDMGGFCPATVYAHEPRGPNASAGGDQEDPLPLVHDYIQAALASTIHGFGPFNYRGYTFHSQPGVWGGHCGVESENAVANFWEMENAAAIAAALKAVRANTLPDPGPGPGPGPQPPDPEMPLIPYDEAKSIEFGTACNAIYEETTIPKDPGMVSVHASRAAWDYYVGGLSWPDSYQKHINEFRAEYGLPPV